MLRRFERSSSDAPPPTPPSSDGNRPPPSSSTDQMSSLQRYRSQTMKDYGLMIEYKHLRQHVPGGIYVLPSFDETRVWYGTIFIHTGLYRNGIFKFTIYLPENYNGVGTYPRIVFATDVFHPYVNPETRELDLTPKFPNWDPELHYMVAVLTYLKSIFYLKDFPLDDAAAVPAANPTALDLFRRKGDDAFLTRVEQSVDASLEAVYTNDHNSTIRFTKHNPAHDNLRRELFAQLDATENPTAERSSDVAAAGVVDGLEQPNIASTATTDRESLEEKSATGVSDNRMSSATDTLPPTSAPANASSS